MCFLQVGRDTPQEEHAVTSRSVAATERLFQGSETAFESGSIRRADLLQDRRLPFPHWRYEIAIGALSGLRQRKDFGAPVVGVHLSFEPAALFQRPDRPTDLGLVLGTVNADPRRGCGSEVAKGRQNTPFRPIEAEAAFVDGPHIVADRFRKTVQAIG